MSTQEPGRAQPGLTPLPRIEDLPSSTDGYDRAKVQDAFDSFRRHLTSLQANLRVLQAAPQSATSEPSGHAVRMDALHLVRAAAEFADTIERDALDAASKQVARAEQEIREKQMELQQQEAEIARIRQETERQRTEILSASRKESREILTKANRDSTAARTRCRASMRTAWPDGSEVALWGAAWSTRRLAWREVRWRRKESKASCTFARS